MSTRSLVFPTLVLAVCTFSSSAQMVTSAHSGTLHTFDGKVSLDGKPVEKRPGYFPEMKDGNILSTQRGRAEVLLTPGVIARVGENTSIKMLDNRLASTRVELLSGSLVLEQIEPKANGGTNSVTLVSGDYQVSLRKDGLLELYSDPPQVKVYKGDAEVVAANGQSVVRSVVKGGHMASLNAVLASEKLDEKSGDDLLLWARDRSMAISTANMASARGYSSGNSFNGGYYGGAASNGWYYNPSYGMFTYLPLNGTYWSPWGFGFYSPYTIYDVYYPGGYTWAGGGKATGPTGVTLSHAPTASSMANTLNRLNRASPGGPIHSVAPPVTAGYMNRGVDSGFSAATRDAGAMHNMGGRNASSPSFSAPAASAPAAAASHGGGGGAAAASHAGGGRR